MASIEIGAAPRRGGRPTRDEAAALGERIIEVATRLFLSGGFGATSIEGVAATAAISKRTFYHRFRDKPDLFRAVLKRLVTLWVTPFEAQFAMDAPVEEILAKVARATLTAAMSAEALALYRMLIAEAPRFPELARIATEQSAAAGNKLGSYLAAKAQSGELAIDDIGFATEQFINLVLAGPRRRALGLGPAMSPHELDRWIHRSVTLFLNGYRPR